MFSLPSTALSGATSTASSLGANVADAVTPVMEAGIVTAGVEASVSGPGNTLLRRIATGRVEGPGPSR